VNAFLPSLGDRKIPQLYPDAVIGFRSVLGHEE